ncbi:MAG: MBL fold metallo-hydrolase [Acidocella sp. 20-57-95]|nr:MAG: MBL fold metallo-hydrolase [Acidocella sp. 20-57-95]OYV60420.1 MAG: MBL fold metallo-hydrolase [Acidocella sp. 21-58-7]
MPTPSGKLSGKNRAPIASAQSPDGFVFVPLGGTGEIGMNFNLYGCDGDWLAVDCGMGFAGPEAPEAELLLADPAYIAARADRLKGLVITHAHEDHIGGVARLWPQLRCPIYASPFTAAVLRRKLNEAGLGREVKLHVIKPGAQFELAPFSLQYIQLTHSTPESQALAISTKYGTVLHTGDFKFDPHPVVGASTDEATLKALGDKGVLAIVIDSTNAMVDGHSGSELDVRKSLKALIGDMPGRIAVTCFASNIARVASVIAAAEACGRHVALIGRSLGNYVAAAQEAGYLLDVPDFVPEEDLSSIPDENLLILATGSQGEPRSAMARIAADTHRYAVLGEGDVAIFSSRMIPGNEKAITAVQDTLVRRGVDVITDDDELTHCSGHPARDELIKMYKLVRPRYLVPTHGEWRHLSAQAALAEEEGITSILIENGDVLSLSSNKPEVIDSVPTGRLAVDGNAVVPLKGGVMAARRRMLFNGVVVGSAIIDSKGKVQGQARVSAPGLLDEDVKLQRELEAEFADLLGELPSALRKDEAAYTDAARAVLRKIVGKRMGKRPIVEAHIMRI